MTRYTRFPDMPSCLPGRMVVSYTPLTFGAAQHYQGVAPKSLRATRTLVMRD